MFHFQQKKRQNKLKHNMERLGKEEGGGEQDKQVHTF